MPMNLEPPSHPALKWALEILRTEESRRSDPTIAVLGPAGSGKTDLLRALLMHSAQTGPRKPVHLDLYGVTIGQERAMYEQVVARMEQALRDAGLTVPKRDETEDAMRRFDALLILAAKESGSRLMLAFDHFEAVPRAFATSLSQRLRFLRERSDEVGNLGLVVAGTISLSDLTSPSRPPPGSASADKSAFDAARVVQLPRQDEASAREYINQSLEKIGVADADPGLVEILVRETWGEPCFLNAILQRKQANESRLTPELLKQWIEAVDCSEVLHLRHAVLHLHFDHELQDIVQNVLREKRIPRRGNTIDIDEFHLTGVVVLDPNLKAPVYTMRNSMVTRLVRHFLNESGFESREPRLSADVEEINRTRQGLLSARTIWDCVWSLQRAWEILTTLEAPRLHLMVAAPDYSRRRALELPGANQILPCIERAIAAAHESGKAAFDGDEQLVTIAVPLRGTSDVFCSLAATVTNQQRVFTEYSLQHWKAFVRSIEPSLIRLALAEVLKQSWNEREVSTATGKGTDARVTAQLYLNIQRGEALVFRPGGLDRAKGVFDEGWVKRVHELDQDLVNSGTTKTRFQRSVERVGAEVAVVLKEISKVTEWLTDDAESHDWVIASPVDGLKVPFELLHGNENKTPLLLKTGVTRRIQGFDVPKAVRLPIPGLLKRLAELDQPLRVLLVGTDASGKLPVEDEIARVKRRIESGAAAFQLKCEIIEVPPELASADRVQKEFAKKPLHLFHFCGHGYRDGNEGGIVLNLRGEAEPVSSEQLAAWMMGRGLWLAYLSACRTAAVSGDGLTLSSGLFEDLLGAGVPNVVGFRWPVTWKSGLVLAEEFYKELFERPRGSDPAVAMLHARLAAKGMTGLSDAWASSVLVTQCPV